MYNRNININNVKKREIIFKINQFLSHFFTYKIALEEEFVKTKGFTLFCCHLQTKSYHASDCKKRYM